MPIAYFLIGFVSFPMLLVATVLSQPKLRKYVEDQTEITMDEVSKAQRRGFSLGREFERKRQVIWCWGLRRGRRRRYRAQAPMVLVAPHTGE